MVFALADDASGTVDEKADLTSFNSNGFTFNYSTSDATIRESIYLAVGNAIAGAAQVPRNNYMAPILTQ
jgi:hypothetical protein